jgi:hypothetical protein
MKAVSSLRAWAASLLRRARRPVRPHRRPRPVRPIEGLEPRWTLSAGGAAPPAVVMLSATTSDSKSVTITYQVNPSPGGAASLQFGIYRSSDDRFDFGDTLVELTTPVPPGGPSDQPATLDQGGQPATAAGTHQLTIPLPQGLPPYPKKPYVLVVADPGDPAAATDPQQTASFRTYVIGVVTHGGLEDPSWKHGPPWELQIAYYMKHEGYDAVIAYNWVAQSSTPGDAIKQAPRLAGMIRRAVARFPASAPVDLQLIGHSEGNVVNTYALVDLRRRLPHQFQEGYIEDTLLDPHAANNNVPGQQYSPASGPLGGLADGVVQIYQSHAHDPPVFIPSLVDAAQVFYEHTTARKQGGFVNLWGQVPVRVEGPGPVVHYYDLTAAGATHSGKKGVALWYRDFIAPTLGNQAPLIRALQLDGQIEGASTPSPTTTAAAAGPTGRAASVRRAIARDDRGYGPAQVVSTRRPAFSGTAAPGSAVRLYVGPADRPPEIVLAGWTTADQAGHWSLATRRPLPDGQYRAIVTAFSRALRTRPGLTIVPTQPLGRFVVDAPTSRADSDGRGSVWVRVPPHWRDSL